MKETSKKVGSLFLLFLFFIESVRIRSRPPLEKFEEHDDVVDEMLRTFNCGLGFCIVVSADFADDVVDQCRRLIDLEVSKVGHVAIRDDSKPIIVDNVKQALKRSYVKVWPKICCPFRQNGFNIFFLSLMFLETRKSCQLGRYGESQQKASCCYYFWLR